MDSCAYGTTFHGLGLPDKVAYTMELAIRFIPTLARGLSVTLDTQKARGYEIEKVKGGIFNKMARIAPLLVPVTMNAIVNSEDVANAIDLRCFGQAKRTWIYPLEYYWWDYVLIGLSALMLAGSIVAAHVLGLGGFWTPEWFMNLYV